MIDARELRIGNLLEADIGYVKVESILGSQFRAYCHSIDEEYLANYPLNHLEPIPLTPDILIKCGFDKDDDDDAYKGNCIWSHNKFDVWLYGIIPVSVYRPTPFTVTENKQPDGAKPIHHLHQLQNLYHALTQTELEIQL